MIAKRKETLEVALWQEVGVVGRGTEPGRDLGVDYPAPFGSIQSFFRSSHFSKRPCPLKPVFPLHNLVQDVVRIASGPVHISTESFRKEGKQEGKKESRRERREDKKPIWERLPDNVRGLSGFKMLKSGYCHFCVSG